MKKIDEIMQQFSTSGLCSPKAGRIYGRSIGSGDPDTEYLILMGLYPLPDPAAPSEPGTGVIAPFAAVHHYRQIASRLKKAVRSIRETTGLSKGEIRIFSNSRLPERSMAAALGLGWVGRNGLLMNREFGSAFLLGGLLIASEETGDLALIESLIPPADPHYSCGTCRACIEACPTNALLAGGGFIQERCLQYLSTFDGPLPDFAEEVWGLRIYGCQLCQDACPVNTNRKQRGSPLPAGREVRSLAPLLTSMAADPGQSLRELLPDTALEAGWIPRNAILRNLLTAAGNSGDRELKSLIQPFLESSTEYVRHAAAKALTKLG